MTRSLLPNTSTLTNTFDSVGRELSTVLKNSGGTVMNSHTYLVNKAAQRTRQTRTDGSYVTYDDENQLTSAATDTTNWPVATRWKTDWGCDARGRMRTRKDYTHGGTA